jgi:hypothetical protein
MNKRRTKNCKKGISALLGAIFLFSMLFTTGVGFFLFTLNSTQMQNIAAKEMLVQSNVQSTEEFLISGDINGTNYLQAVVNNTGPIPVQIVYTFVIKSDGTMADVIDQTSEPITINPADGATITTSAQYSGGDYTLKVVSLRGTMRAVNYPLNNIFDVAEISEGFGSIRLYFNSFSYFLYGGDYDILTNYPSGNPAADSPANVPMAFGITIRNLDPTRRALTFSNQTCIWQFNPNQGNNIVWYIVNVIDKGDGTAEVMNTYTPIVVPYGETITLVFASKVPGQFSASNQQVKAPAAWQQSIASVFILGHGQIGSIPYGQNLPYTSVYWY